MCCVVSWQHCKYSNIGDDINMYRSLPEPSPKHAAPPRSARVRGLPPAIARWQVGLSQAAVLPWLAHVPIAPCPACLSSSPPRLLPLQQRLWYRLRTGAWLATWQTRAARSTVLLPPHRWQVLMVQCWFRCLVGSVARFAIAVVPPTRCLARLLDTQRCTARRAPTCAERQGIRTAVGTLRHPALPILPSSTAAAHLAVGVDHLAVAVVVAVSVVVVAAAAAAAEASSPRRMRHQRSCRYHHHHLCCC